MNETNGSDVVKETAGEPVAENESEQAVQELTAEEKLSERERLVSEREKAIELKERTMNIAKLLKEKGISPELAEFLRIDSDGNDAENIDRLASILSQNNKANLPRISTGLEHTSCSFDDSESDFIHGFKH